MANRTEIPRFSPIKSGQILSEVEAVLEDVFTETGKHAVFYHLQTKYDIVLQDAVVKPAEFAEALTNFFGEFGAKVLVARMVQRVFKLTGIRYETPLKTKDFEAAVHAAAGGFRDGAEFVRLTQ